jgi:hypothetical protein
VSEAHARGRFNCGTSAALVVEYIGWKLYLTIKSGAHRMRQVLVYPGEDTNWVAECPSLPGCISQGKTKEEAVINKELDRGTLRAIMRHAGISVEEFTGLL